MRGYLSTIDQGRSGLKGHIDDCNDSCQGDLYTITTKDMAGYVAAAIENGNEVKIMIEMQVSQSHF